MENITAEIYASATGTSGNTEPAKRKFFQWAVKWFYANISEECKEKPDASTLACLLQSIGFQLRQFEKIEVLDTEKKELKNENLKVTIECGTSGMRALLEMDDVKCQCPNPKDAKDASFWSVSGTGPVAGAAHASATDQSSTNKVEDSGSNLLPPVSKEMKKVLNQVMYRLVNMINDKSTDVNHNDKSRSNLNLSQTRRSGSRDIINTVENHSINIVRSRTQPEIAVSGTNSAVHRYNSMARSSVKDSVSRLPRYIQKGWNETMNYECESIDGDQPRPSPLKIASSPVFFNQLTSPLSQISLQSDEDSGNLAEHVIRAHKYLEKAVEILLDRRSPLSRNSPNYEAEERTTFLKPPTGRFNLSGMISRKKGGGSSSSLRSSPTNLPTSRPGSSCSMPDRIHSSSAKSNKPNMTMPVKSPVTRRSVGSAISRLSTTPLSSIPTAKRNVQSGNNNLETSLSKIPARRKSFGALAGQSLKLSLPIERNSASGTKKNSNSLASITTEERVIVTAKRRVSPDPKAVGNTSATLGIQTPGSFQHEGNTSATSASSTTVSPSFKPAITKTINQTTKEVPTRKLVANAKFGYCKKK